MKFSEVLSNFALSETTRLGCWYESLAIQIAPGSFINRWALATVTPTPKEPNAGAGRLI
jgi:hypothetical protein